MSWPDFEAGILSKLDQKKLSLFLDATHTRPNPSATQLLGNDGWRYSEQQTRWDEGRRAANGLIYAALPANVRTDYITTYRANDPVAFMRELQTRFGGARPGLRFSAIENQLSLTKDPNETYMKLYDRNAKLGQERARLRDPNATVATVDKEINVLCLIRALSTYDQSQQDATIVSAVNANIASTAAVSLTFVKNMFTNYDDMNKRKHEQQVANRSREVTNNDAKKDKISIQDGLKKFHEACGLSACFFCNSTKHTTERCFKIKELQASWEKARKSYNSNRDAKKQGWKPKAKANAANEVNVSDATSQLESFSVSQRIFATSAQIANLARSSTTIAAAMSRWNTDTGCSTTMTGVREHFKTYMPYRVPIQLADGHVVYSAGVGSVEFVPVVNGSDAAPFTFERVLHVPQLSVSLFSVYQAMSTGVEVHGKARKVYFKRDGRLLMTASVGKNNIGYLDGHTTRHENTLAYNATVTPTDLALWHRRLAHVNHDAVLDMQRSGAAKGIRITGSKKPHLCEPCIAGKLHRHNVPKGPKLKALERLDLVHADLKMLPTSIRGYKYWVVFIDDYSRYRCEYFLRRKSDLFDAFKSYVAYAETHTGRKLKVFHNDKGGEFVSNELATWMKERGMLAKHTERDEPYQNGVAERAHRDSVEAVTSMLNEAGLPPAFWPWAMSHYTRVKNSITSSALDHNVTPHELWHNRKADVSRMRVWGCLAYALVPADKRRTLDSHYSKCLFLGYSKSKPGCWIFYEPSQRTFFESSQAVFDESTFPGNRMVPADIVTPPSGSVFETLEAIDDEPLDEDSAFSHSGGAAPLAAPPPAPPVIVLPAPKAPVRLPDTAPDNDLPRPPSTPRRSTRSNISTKSLTEPDLRRTRDYPSSRVGETSFWTTEELEFAMSTAINELVDGSDLISYEEALELAFSGVVQQKWPPGLDTRKEPRSLAEARSRPNGEGELWEAAAQEELTSLIRMGCITLTKLPSGVKAIPSKWVFKVKKDEHGLIERLKARIVARGDRQRPGFDFTETFAPTPRWAAQRSIFALAALEDMELHSVDVTAAFLNGDLDEKIYMRLPEGLEREPGSVELLKKSLYGLKQGARQWLKKLHEVLTEMGFERVKVEQSCWTYGQDQDRVIVPTHIDDMTIAAKTKDRIREVVAELSKHFKIRDLGPTKFVLGVEVIRDRSRRMLGLSQRQYINDTLRMYGLEDCSPTKTPMDPKAKISAADCPVTEEEKAEMRSVPFINLLGRWAYLATASRPDIAYACSKLAQVQRNPGMEHWKALKHLSRYLAGTRELMLVYAPDASSSGLFMAYSDADHAGDSDTARSTSGVIMKMGTGAVSWSSKLQPIVTLSSTEAEYVAACSTGQEAAWLRSFLSSLGYDMSAPSTLFMDNKSAVCVARNPEHQGRMKHIDVRWHWLREAVERGEFKIEHIPTASMPADILTKALPAQKIEPALRMLGLARTFDEFM